MAYITVQDLLNEGVTDLIYPKAVIEERIALACGAVDLLTGCFFEKRAGHIVKANGASHNMIWLPYPPISVNAITSVVISGETLDAEYWEAVMDTVPDGRFNPKILHLTGTFPTGVRNVVITGDFGFVESDETVPPMIKQLCKRIAILELPRLGDASAQRKARIIEESLDKYRYRLAELDPSKQGIFGDPKIDGVLALFHKPAMGTI